ncbi:hypothetical protein PR048_028494 [Dryococelus australis]|uniref:Uncharacterized protein n=1 Tax=Dryococelus australis TaxID=614101 RepID=A0ABQ9GDI2_9NEOP|nr:hypothetical protein PR048_028494 [Dryococelus australis]
MVPALSTDDLPTFARRCVIAATPAEVIRAQLCKTWMTISKQTVWCPVDRYRRIFAKASSPDLNPLLNFRVWGYDKSLVCNTADVVTPEELRCRIVHAFQQTKNGPGLLECIRGSLLETTRQIHPSAYSAF